MLHFIRSFIIIDFTVNRKSFEILLRFLPTTAAFPAFLGIAGTHFRQQPYSLIYKPCKVFTYSLTQILCYLGPEKKS